MKQHTSGFAILLIGSLLCLFTACSNPHFLTDEAYRHQVEQDFQLKQTLLPHGDLFSIFRDATLTTYEREALQFLYAYMPTADIADYPGTFHLMNIRASQRAAREMPWGEIIPEELFRHFVLPVRVNNEPLDSFRMTYYDELKTRVGTLSLPDAILEVNHWCHEKAIYQPSDARTSSPLATLRTAYGRCGEESTLLVAALRAVGIPARQVYTPRWAHTDDNHAWVEAWAGDGWHFLGACEPEPVLDLGWFNAPASRGMLMHTKVFGRYQGTEEIVATAPGYTEINVTDNYAPTARAQVTVVNSDNKPVAGAKVEFKLYNYAEFYTIATKQTDNNGNCHLTAGKGDMLVWASKEGQFGFAKLSLGKQDALTVKLEHQDGDTFALDIDITPPAESATLPVVTPAQQAENDRRILQEDSIRNLYVSTMMTTEKAQAWVNSLYGDALHPVLKKKVATLLANSRGNHPVLTAFLSELRIRGKQQEKGDRHISYEEANAIDLLQAISDKDLRDIRPEVLADHLNNTPQLENATAFNAYILRRALLNPRISTEELTPYKSFFQQVIDTVTAADYRQHPQKLATWCRNNITLNDTLNAQSISISPIGVWKSRVADTHSRNIFFVAVARSLGIPAWINEVTGAVCYQDLTTPSAGRDGKTFEIDFGNGDKAKAITPTGQLIASYQPSKYLNNPKYYSHFTLSRCKDGVLRLQNYDESEASWSNLLRLPLQMPAGYYLMVSGTRLASGSVLAHLNALNVEESQITKTDLLMRESKDQIQVIGNFNSESLFTPITADGKVADAPTSLLKACERGYFAVGVLGANQEPTNHALKDIAKVGKELEKWGRRLILLFTDEAQYRKYRPEEFPGLPNTIIYGIDSHGIAPQIVTGMELKHSSLPLFILADTFNRVVFVSQGYTIGLGEQLVRTVNGL